MSDARRHRFPLCSILSIGCPVLLLGLFLFLSTEQAKTIHERLCQRYYTLGMLIIVIAYGAIGLVLCCPGFSLGILGRVRREAPSWLAWSAVAANTLAAFSALLYLRGQSGWTVIVVTMIGSVLAGCGGGLLARNGNRHPNTG